MKVSVITPFYQGNAYMDSYAAMVEANVRNLQSGDELEVLLVNDSPWEEIALPERSLAAEIHILKNEKNLGIHGSRVRGLAAASGEYVLFLDQDDELAENAVALMLDKQRQETVGRSVIVGNAVLEQADSEAVWYRSEYHKRLVGDLDTYLKVGTQIISPGQCLIPKAVIPQLWTQRICKKNGADDYYLWLLLLEQGVPFVFLDQLVYRHRYTGENLSADTRVTDDSSFEFLTYMEEEQAMAKKKIDLLRRMLRYKDAFRRGSMGKKLAESLKNPDLFAANVMFKLRSKTPYGFNRG